MNITVASIPITVHVPDDNAAADLVDLSSRYGDLTLEQYGEWVSRWPEQATGVFQGYCLMRYQEQEARKRLERDGCCDERGADVDGNCRILKGKCGLYERVCRLIREESINWRSEDEYARAIERAADD